MTTGTRSVQPEFGESHVRALLQVVPTLEAKNPAIRTWRKTEDGGPANLPTSVIYMDLPVGLFCLSPLTTLPWSMPALNGGLAVHRVLRWLMITLDSAKHAHIGGTPGVMSEVGQVDAKALSRQCCACAIAVY